MICTHVITRYQKDAAKYCSICAPLYIDELLTKIEKLNKKINELEKQAIWCGDDRVR